MIGLAVAEKAHPSNSQTPDRWFSIADISNDISKNLENVHRRLALLRSLGFDAVRTGVVWEDFEGNDGVWTFSAAKAKYLEIIIQSGMKLKLEVNVWAGVPNWFMAAHPEAYVLNEQGRRDKNYIAPWFSGLATLLKQKQARIIEDLSNLGILDSVCGVVAGLGPAGEAIYPAQWEVPGMTQDSFWFYGEQASISFRVFAKEKYGNIGAAVRVWGVYFPSWDAVAVPSPGRAPGALWSDVLSWYRDEKRSIVAQLAEGLRAELKGAVPCFILIPGAHSINAELASAIATGDGDGGIKVMVDTEFLLALANKMGFGVQPTAAQDANEVRYISGLVHARYPNVKIALENAGGAPSLSPAHLADVFLSGRFVGFDYIGAASILGPGGEPNNVAGELKQALTRMRRT